MKSLSCLRCTSPILGRRANAKYCSPDCEQAVRAEKIAARDALRGEYEGSPSPAGWEEARRAAERIRKGAMR